MPSFPAAELYILFSSLCFKTFKYGYSLASGVVLPLWQPPEHTVLLPCCQGHGALTWALTVPAQRPWGLPSTIPMAQDPTSVPAPATPWEAGLQLCHSLAWSACWHPGLASARFHPQGPARPSWGCVWSWFPAPGLNLTPAYGVTSWPGLVPSPSPGRCLMAGAAPRLPWSLAGVVGQALAARPCPASPGDPPLLRGFAVPWRMWRPVFQPPP